MAALPAGPAADIALEVVAVGSLCQTSSVPRCAPQYAARVAQPYQAVHQALLASLLLLHKRPQHTNALAQPY